MSLDTNTIEIILILAIICSGFLGLATAKNIIRSILCLNLTQTGIILLFLALVHNPGMLPPVMPGAIESMVDPTPEALVITTIVIGAAITSLSLMMSIKIFHHYGTLEWKELTRREG